MKVVIINAARIIPAQYVYGGDMLGFHSFEALNDNFAS